jgi:hypothetical protein
MLPWTKSGSPWPQPTGRLFKRIIWRIPITPCDWQWRGITVKNAGVRVHGHGSRSPVKPALEVKFNEFTKGQKFLGVTKSVLKNSVEDASFLRDPLSLR